MQTGGHDGSARTLAAPRGAGPAPDLLAELTLCADADSLGLARLATLHVAGLLGVPVGRLAELRLAVNEACALLFHAPASAVAEGVGAAAFLHLRFERQRGRLCITVRGSAPYRSPHPEEIGWILLRALVDEVRMDTAGGITTLTLCEPLPQPPR
ncbi:hypothetical protein KDL01_20450 [Actinospica durhamensis]|uniref:Histidine kinase/HSP90-like ATPase domain-containing protein n=1 Tax=Actinospica durhamensis TaxID=1508375 RepID=A0A941ER62_9ACTN|nr:ATP-binding protein [Actinospica durhamensis]MBR7835658.1 hypothetical protein [Actinospica durhamensis]